MGCSTTDSAPPVASPQTLKTTPRPPRSSLGPSPGPTTSRAGGPTLTPLPGPGPGASCTPGPPQLAAQGPAWALGRRAPARRAAGRPKLVTAKPRRWEPEISGISPPRVGPGGPQPATWHHTV